MNELRSQQRLATHKGKHARTYRVDPVDRAFCNVLGHSLDGIVVRPAVVTIQIALPFREQGGNEWTQFGTMPARFEIGRGPAFHRADCVKLLILALAHLPRIEWLRVKRLRQNFLMLL